MSLAFSVCQKMSEISSIVLSSFSATATSSRLLDVARAVHAVPEQLVQVRELLEVVLGEEVGPQHHQVMLDLFGALLLDDDRARLEVVVVGVVVLLQRLQAGQRLDLGLSGVVDTAVQVAVGVGRGGVGEESMQACDSTYPLGMSGNHPSRALAAASVPGRRRLDAPDAQPRRRAARASRRRRAPPRPVAGVPRPDEVHALARQAGRRRASVGPQQRDVRGPLGQPARARAPPTPTTSARCRRRAPTAWCGRSAAAGADRR